MVVEELRRTDRFVVNEPIAGSFGASDASVLNLSIIGAQISHPQPLRIGTSARLAFRRGSAVVETQARVLWSHVFPSPGGKLLYRTGLRIDDGDTAFALAINTLLRAGELRRDLESLERKRQRDEAREKKKSGPKLVPTSEPPPA